MIRPFDNITPTIDPSCYIDQNADIIGNVTIAEHSSVWPMSVIRGDVNSIRIGRYTNIQDGSVLHVTHDSHFHPGGAALEIGDYVTVGHKVMLHGCTIRDYCLIGMGAIVMDSSIIEERVMIGAGSIVPPNKRLGSGYLYLGNPCKRIRALKHSEFEYLEYAAEHYARLKQRYL